jgi:hypothetical protein
MNKTQNRNMGRKRMQENITPQKSHNHTITDMMDSEGE